MPNQNASVAETVKDLISEPSKRIQLDDYVNKQLHELLEAISIEHFPVQNATIQPQEFTERINRYNEALRDIQTTVILLARWGDPEHLLLLKKIFMRLTESLEQPRDGLVVWSKLGWYPVHLLMYAAGISGLASQKYEVVKMVLLLPINYKNGIHPLVIPAVACITDLHDEFKLIPGHGQHIVPRSEYLYELLKPELEKLLFLGGSYDDIFDEFEIYVAFTFMEATNRSWGPIGRFGWKYQRNEGHSSYDLLLATAKKKGAQWPPISVGIFEGSIEEFLEAAEAYKVKISNLTW